MVEFKPDLVHVVNPAVVGYSGVTYAKKLAIPLVASYHTNIPQYMAYYKLGQLDWIMWWFMKKMHNTADLNLCTSQTILMELKEKGFERLQVWKRGVDTEKFNPKQASPYMRNRLTDGRNEKTVLLYVGRLAAEKEIEKIREVLSTSDQFTLAIVGDGPHRKELEAYFKDTPTVFTGFLHHQELASAYASADVFVFPSTTETLGLVIMEAMASGLPVVAAISGPTQEQVIHQRNGLLYDARISTSFAQTILHLQDIKFRQQLAKQALLDVEDWGWAGAAEQIRDIYEEVAGIEKPTAYPAIE